MKKTTLIAMVALAMVTVSCSKEESKSDGKEIFAKNGTRHPFAVRNNISNTFTYTIDEREFNAGLNNNLGYTDDYRFWLESVTIYDSVPRSTSVFPEIRYVILDSEEECSYTFWLMGSFLRKENQTNTTEYYWDDDVVSENYTMDYFSRDTNFMVGFRNGIISKHILPNINSSWQPRWTITCKAKNCRPLNPGEVACGKIKLSNHVWDCNYNCDFTVPGAECRRDTSWILSILKWTVSISIN